MRFHHESTYHHQLRVAKTAFRIARYLGFSRSTTQAIAIAAATHDIGKLAISPDLLDAPRKLYESERQMMRYHPLIGVDILRGAGICNVDVLEAVEAHHECANGQGYPYGLKGDSVGTGARIVAAADVYDVLRFGRAYVKPHSLQETHAIMRETHPGTLDPSIVSVLCAVTQDDHTARDVFFENAMMPRPQQFEVDVA